jgi:hypothetical protein
MSVELLLVIAFILLPLIQQLLRAANERKQGQPQQPGGTSRRATPPVLLRPKPPSHDALPSALAVSPPPAPATLPTPTMTEPTRTLRSTREAVIPGPAARGSLRQGGMRARLRGSRNLRDGIVLMTILRPCLALADDDLSGRVDVQSLRAPK